MGLAEQADPAAITAAVERRARIEPLLGAHRYREAASAAREWLADLERDGRAASVEAAYALDLIVQAVSRTSEAGAPDAIALGQRCVDLKRRLFGETHLEYAESLGYFARLLRQTKDSEVVARVVQDALAIQERTIDRADRRARLLYARNLLEAAALDRQRSSSTPGLERVIQIAETDADAETLAKGLQILAGRRSDWSEKRRLWDRAATLYDGLGGEDLQRAACLANAATASLETNDTPGTLTRLREAEAALERARRDVPGGTPHDQLSYPALWSQVGLLYQQLADGDLKAGRFGEALPLAEHALAVINRESTHGDDYLVTLLITVAHAAAGAGRPGQAFDAGLQSERVRRANVRATASRFSELTASESYAFNFVGLDAALSLLADARVDDASSLESAWDSVVRSRGLVLQELMERYGLVRESIDPETRRLADAARAARERLANMVVGTPGLAEDDPGYHAAHDAREAAERALAAHLLPQRTAGAAEAVGLAQVAGALPPRTALVAYRAYRHFTWQPGKAPRESAGDAYVAFVMEAGSTPKVVPLGPAADIQRLVGAMADTFDEQVALATGPSRRLEQVYRTAAGELRRKVWDPIAPLVGRSTRVFIVPDGVINLINFDALPIDATRYLVESGPVLHYVAAERDVVVAAPPVSSGGMLAIGAPVFDVGRSAAPGARRVPPQAVSAPAAPAKFRGRALGCGAFDELQFDELPGSESELPEVSAAWGRGTRSPVTLLTGAVATETAFKAAAPGHRVLHVSSHGFFLNGPCDRNGAPTAADRIGDLTWTDEGITGKHPLLLSGFALTGPVPRNPMSAGGDDGVLTADEIAMLDLGGVEWAVLSACETGVGKVRAGEGVLGLRRAFQVAGVHTVIMSLWQIEDQGARDWMRRLYQHRFSGHLETSDAVRAATLDELRARRAAGLSTHPIYWAGFVAMGDWR